MAVSVGHVTPRQTSERELAAPSRVAAANYSRSDAHATRDSETLARGSGDHRVYAAREFRSYFYFFFYYSNMGQSSLPRQQ